MFHKYYCWKQCLITKLPKYFIENPILPFDKSKDNTSLELTLRQILLISLLCNKISLSMLLQSSPCCCRWKSSSSSPLYIFFFILFMSFIYIYIFTQYLQRLTTKSFQNFLSNPSKPQWRGGQAVVVKRTGMREHLSAISVCVIV